MPEIGVPGRAAQAGAHATEPPRLAREGVWSPYTHPVDFGDASPMFRDGGESGPSGDYADGRSRDPGYPRALGAPHPDALAIEGVAARIPWPGAASSHLHRCRVIQRGLEGQGIASANRMLELRVGGLTEYRSGHIALAESLARRMLT